MALGVQMQYRSFSKQERQGGLVFLTLPKSLSSG